MSCPIQKRTHINGADLQETCVCVCGAPLLVANTATRHRPGAERPAVLMARLRLVWALRALAWLQQEARVRCPGPQGTPVMHTPATRLWRASRSNM